MQHKTFYQISRWAAPWLQEHIRDRLNLPGDKLSWVKSLHTTKILLMLCSLPTCPGKELSEFIILGRNFRAATACDGFSKRATPLEMEFCWGETVILLKGRCCYPLLSNTPLVAGLDQASHGSLEKGDTQQALTLADLHKEHVSFF